MRSLLDEVRDGSNGEAMLLLDPRPLRAHEGARLPLAQHVELSDIPVEQGRDPLYERYKRIVIYGEHPSDAVATALAKRMMRIKYKDVFVYDGGVTDWRAAGLPVESGPLPYAGPPVRRPVGSGR